MDSRKILWLGLLATVGVLTATTSAKARTPINTNLSDTSGGQTTSPPSTPIDNFNGNGVPPTTTIDPSTGIISGGGISIPIEFGSGSRTGSGTGFGSGTGSSSGSGAGLGTPEIIDSGSANGSGAGGGAGGGVGTGDENTASATGSSGGVTVDQIDKDLEQKPQKITLNDAAELLENNLDDSVATLTAAEKAADLAGEPGQDSAVEPGVARTNPPEDGEARRIARNSNTRRNALGNDARRVVRNSAHCSNACANPDLPTVKARQVDPQEVMAAREVVDRQLEASKKFIEQVNKIELEKNIW